MPDWTDLQSLVQMNPGMQQAKPGVDREVVEHMLDQEKGLATKSSTNAIERNMLILLALADRELGCDTSKFRQDFMQNQLSLDGFNRHSLERMINPVTTSYSYEAKAK